MANSTWTSIIITILIIIILFDCKKSCYEFFTLKYIKSDIDGIKYPVVASYVDNKEAASRIGEMNIFALKLIKKLKDVYLDKALSEVLSKDLSNESKVAELPEVIKGREIANTLIKKFNSKSLQENEPDSVNKTSYTTNKGEVISLCLREKKSGKNKFHNKEILQFVLIHELSHIITPEINHSVLFWINFKFLLEFCNKYDLYTAPDYEAFNENYCGLDISYNPTTDHSLISYFANITK